MAHPRLSQLLTPRSLAIVGANDKGNIGARALANARESGFDGPLYVVNPNHAVLAGVPCYPSLASLPQIPDAVVISVPAVAALKILAEAASIGVPAIVLFSEGFADAGTSSGTSRNEELLAIAQSSGMAISGPNSMGIFSLQRRFAASFVPRPAGLKPGGISIISQSGGLINASLELGRNRHLGFNYVISAGNEAVISAADYLEFLAADEETKVILCVLEGIKDGRRFRTALAEATRRKPVAILKLGTSESGGRAAMAHTGSLAGGAASFRALCAQSGAVLCSTIDALIETAALFLAVPLPRGDRSVIFSTSGGATVLTTDLAAAAGLRFPPLSPETNAALQAILEVERPFANPFDVVGQPRLVKDDNMTRCLTTILGDPVVDLVGCVMVVPRDATAGREKLLGQVKAAMASATKPVIIFPEMVMHWQETPPDAGTHIASSLQDGLVAVRGLIDYAAYRRRTITVPLEAAPIRVTSRAGCTVLTEYESKLLLGAHGLPVTREALAVSLDEALAAARRIGFPVALKLQSPDLMHKTEAGGVILDIGTESELREAYAALKRRAASFRLDGVLVQEMVSASVEFLLGMQRDPILGPVVVLSPGGIFAELFDQAAILRLPPFDREEASAMVEASQAAQKLLAGFRGKKPGDGAALVDLVTDFAAFVARLGEEVLAIDLNPVMVRPDGLGAVIADAAIELAINS